MSTLRIVRALSGRVSRRTLNRRDHLCKAGMRRAMNRWLACRLYRHCSNLSREVHHG